MSAETSQTAAPQLSAEDAKLVTLARSARARRSALEGAAVRDSDGRTYSAATVDLPSLSLSAVQAAVAQAYASAARSLEAVVLVSDSDVVPDDDLAAVRDLGDVGTPVHVAGLDGVLRSTRSAGA